MDPPYETFASLTFTSLAQRKAAVAPQSKSHKTLVTNIAI